MAFGEPDADITMEIQQPFARHLLLGINTFALEMFKQFRPQLGLYARDPYLPGKFAPIISSQDTAISESVDEATTQTATVQILSATKSNGTLTADVLVTNLAGHSFPSGVGFRRAFVNFQVLDSSGKELWASKALGLDSESDCEAKRQEAITNSQDAVALSPDSEVDEDNKRDASNALDQAVVSRCVADNEPRI